MLLLQVVIVDRTRGGIEMPRRAGGAGFNEYSGKNSSKHRAKSKPEKRQRSSEQQVIPYHQAMTRVWKTEKQKLWSVSQELNMDG